MPNYFALFDLEPQFRLNPTLLKSAFIKKQQAPATGPALRQTLNHAYNTLLNDDTRAVYLLQTAGQAAQLDQSIADTEFLQTALELREEIEDCTTEEGYRSLRLEAEDWLKALANEFDIDYSAADWPDARDTVRKMRFMQKIIIDIDRHIGQLTEDALDNPLDDDLF